MPHDLRPLVIAYNDFAIAASDDAYQIGQYSLDRDRERLTVALSFVVIATSAADLAAKEAALDVFRTPNASFVIQQARELELNDLVGDGTATVTSATGGFLAAHVGDWLVIHAVGARRITAVNSSTSAAVHAAVAAGTYRAMKPARLFRGTNVDRTFMRGSGEYEKTTGSVGNTEFSRVYRLTVTGLLPEPNAGLVRLKASVDHDASRRRTFSIDGEIRSTSALAARAIHDANIDALVTLHLAPFDRTRQHQGWDAENLTVGPATVKIYTFRQTWVERFTTGSSPLKNQSLSVTQAASGVHGLGLAGSVMATVAYRANVDHSARSREAMRTLYIGTVRRLIAEAVTAFTGNGRSLQAIEREDATFDHFQSTISASWTILLLGASSAVLAYNSPQSTGNNPALHAVPLWDYKPHTYAVWRGKPSRTRTTTQTIRSLSPIQWDSEGAFVPPQKHPFRVGGLGNAIDVAGVEQHRIRIRWPQNAGGGNVGGRWMQQGAETALESVEIVGNSVFGAFGKTPVYSTTLSRTDLWVVDADPIVPKIGPVTTPSGGI